MNIDKLNIPSFIYTDVQNFKTKSISFIYNVLRVHSTIEDLKPFLEKRDQFTHISTDPKQLHKQKVRSGFVIAAWTIGWVALIALGFHIPLLLSTSAIFGIFTVKGVVATIAIIANFTLVGSIIPSILFSVLSTSLLKHIRISRNTYGSYLEKKIQKLKAEQKEYLENIKKELAFFTEFFNKLLEFSQSCDKIYDALKDDKKKLFDKNLFFHETYKEIPSILQDWLITGFFKTLINLLEEHLENFKSDVDMQNYCTIIRNLKHNYRCLRYEQFKASLILIQALLEVKIFKS